MQFHPNLFFYCYLTSKVEELQEMVNEEELAKLREKLSNENYYIQEINQFHSKREFTVEP